MADETLPAVTAPVLEWDKDFWEATLQASRDAMKEVIERGRAHIAAYETKLLKLPQHDQVVVPNDWIFVEQKKAQLFYQAPPIHLKAQDPQSQANAPRLAAVMNQKILPKIKPRILMDRCIFDLVCPVGFAAVKVGYESHTRDMDMPVLDPATGQPAIDPLTGQPLTQKKSVVISEKCFADRIPPGMFMHPLDFLGGDFNEAAWLAFDYPEVGSDKDASAETWNPDDRLLREVPDRARSESKKPKRRVTEVWYRPSMLGDAEAHPDRIRYFCWRMGEPTPFKHADSPLQTTNPDGTLGGMRGFPIRVLTVRSVSDRAIPPPDAQATRNLADEISQGRSQVLVARERNLPQVGIDGSRVNGKTEEAIEKNINSAVIKFNGPVTDDMMRPLLKGTINQENFIFNQQAERDIERAWALGPNQQGVTAQGSRTATEMQITQANSDTRLDYERARVLEFYCEDIVEPLLALVQMFMDGGDYVEVIGQDGAAALEQWTRATIAGQFKVEVQARAAQRHDAASEQKRLLDYYNLTRNDPFVNPQELTRELSNVWGFDYERIKGQPQEPPPEKPKISLSIKGEDLNPFAPQYRNVKALLAESGVESAMDEPQQQAPPNPQHGGPATPAEPIDKHAIEQTGELAGMGSTERIQ